MSSLVSPAAHGSLREDPGAVLPPLELPGLVMRRAAVVALACLLVIMALGLLRARSDTLREMEGSLDLARASRLLAGLQSGPVEHGLRQLEAIGGLRHLQLELRDEQGRTVLRLADEDSSAWLSQQWHRLMAAARLGRAATEVAYPLLLQDGRRWTAVLSASPDSELLEAAANLLGLFVVTLACCAAMLAAMHWNVRRCLAPLRQLVEAIAGVERQQPAAVKTLPVMPIRELEAIAHALRHLAQAQEHSEDARRVLAHRVMSLQEDERQRLARDLHDEFGQRLTALRVDAAWLQRSAQLQDPARGVVAEMLEQVTLIQDDVRRLLARLRPLGTTPSGLDGVPQTLGRLRSMLGELAAGWTGAGAQRTPQVELRMDEGDDAVELAPELALGLYRITQEALTNVMRHAQAARVAVEAAVRHEGGVPSLLTWQVADDGCGIGDLDAALRRGTGLAGLKDRVWTLGGRFEGGAGLGGRGTALRAEFRLPAEDAP